MALKKMGIGITIGATLQNSLNSAFATIDDRAKNISKSLKNIAFKKDLSTKVLALNKELRQLQQAEIKAGGASRELKEKIAMTKKAFLEAKLEARQYGIELKNASKLNKAFTKLESVKSKNALSLAGANSREQYRSEARGKFMEKAAIGLSIAAPFKAGIEFESSMKRVKALSGATDEEFKKLESTAKKLGSSTVFSASEVGQGMQFLSMAGFKVNETIKAMPGLLDLAAAGQTDLATTADITSNILSGFGINADKTTHVADVLAKAMTTANVDVQMLGETMKYVGPAASSLGASLEDVTTLTALLGNAGIQASNAGTALRSMYLRMASPPTEALKVIKRLGIQTKDANGNFIGMTNVIKQLQEKTKGLGNAKIAEIMKKLFGTEAVSASMVLLKEPVKKINEYSQALENADGTAKKIAKEQNDSAKGAFKALGSAIEGVSISITSLFLPAIKGITTAVTSFTQGLNNFIENHKTLATVIGGATGGVIALSLATYGLKYAFSLVVDGFSTMMRGYRSLVFWTSAEGRALIWNRAQLIATAIKQKALVLWSGILAAKTKLVAMWTNRQTVAQGIAMASTYAFAAAQKVAAFASGAFRLAMMGVNLVLSANPIGLVVTAIGALVTGLVWAYNKFDWFKGGVDKVWGFIKTIFKWSPMGLLMDGFGKAFDWLSSKFEWFSGAIKKMKDLGKSVGSFFGFKDEKEPNEKQQQEEKPEKEKSFFSGWFGSDDETKEKKKHVNNPKFQPAQAMKKAAVATAVTASLAVAQPVKQHNVQNTYNNVQNKNLAIKNIRNNHKTDTKKNLTITKKQDVKHYTTTNKKDVSQTQQKMENKRVVYQTNHINIVINNPTSNVEVQKAVTTALKADASLSDEEI